MDREYAEITPAVLRWARERAGYTVEAVARKLKVKGERVAAWEDGSQPLTFSRLEALAAMFKRPTALFFLPAPPDESPPVVPDFRAAAGLSPELIYQLRRAVERRDVALALAGELDEPVSRFSFECDRHEPPDEAGARLRAVLSVRPDEHLRWNGDANAALNGWKDAAERSGVLVFQASRKELADARGVSLHFDPLAIVVLASDPPAGRCFTLAHELAHLGLRHGGICDLHDDGEELFCNRVAAASLMPEDAVKELSRTLVRRGESWTAAVVERAAKNLCVSAEAMVLRLVDLHQADRAFYNEMKPLFAARARKARDRDDKSSGPPPPVLAVARNGRAYTRLVLEAYRNGRLTAHATSQHLGVGFKFVAEIENNMARYAWRMAS